MAKRGWMKASDLFADERVVAKREEHDRLMRERRALAREASLGLIAELHENGVPVDSPGDLLKTNIRYEHAMPVLLRGLPRLEHLGVKESVVRALSVPSAPPETASILINELESLRDTPSAGALKWAIGNALEVVAGEDVVGALMHIARDPAYGRARQMIVLALGRFPEAEALLVELLSDDDVGGHAVAALAELAPASARDALLPFTEHDLRWIRDDAKKALRRIDERHGNR